MINLILIYHGEKFNMSSSVQREIGAFDIQVDQTKLGQFVKLCDQLTEQRDKLLNPILESIKHANEKGFDLVEFTGSTKSVLSYSGGPLIDVENLKLKFKEEKRYLKEIHQLRADLVIPFLKELWIKKYPYIDDKDNMFISYASESEARKDFGILEPAIDTYAKVICFHITEEETNHTASEFEYKFSFFINAFGHHGFESMYYVGGPRDKVFFYLYDALIKYKHAGYDVGYYEFVEQLKGGWEQAKDERIKVQIEKLKTELSHS